MIIATAGHIDHGKTSLVKALTGVDTDRLPDEKKRGMSIDLGFAYSSNNNNETLGFVDVPGHERFIRNMLAGVLGVDCAMLVVAADDGLMPQTLEHLSIIDLLNISDGVIALTKIDRVSEDRVKAVKSEILELVSRTSIKGADIFPVSSADGRGINNLYEHLMVMSELVESRREGGYFRLAVDRQFNRQGVGLIVTGSVFSGSVSVGDSLVVSSTGAEVRVRNIHAQNRETKGAMVGDRCAINLTGADLKRSPIARGDWVLNSEVYDPVARFDGKLRVILNEEKPLSHWTPVHLHSGTSEALGRVAILEEKAILPGEEGLVQIVLDRRINILKSDYFVIRDQSARRTLGGGYVLDPFPPARGRAKPHRIKFLNAMDDSDPVNALCSLIRNSKNGVDLVLFNRAWNITTEDSELILQTIEHKIAETAGKKTIFSPENWESIRLEIVAKLKDWHKENPDRASLGLHAIRNLLVVKLSVTILESITNEMISEQILLGVGSGFALPGFSPELSKKDLNQWHKIEKVIIEREFQPPVVFELAERLKIEPKELNKFLIKIAKLGKVRQITKNRFLLPDTVIALANIAAQLYEKNKEQGFSASQFRDGTGMGRNLAIEILEFFDKSGLTWRDGDTRKLVKSVTEIF